MFISSLQDIPCLTHHTLPHFHPKALTHFTIIIFTHPVKFFEGKQCLFFLSSASPVPDIPRFLNVCLYLFQRLSKLYKQQSTIRWLISWLPAEEDIRASLSLYSTSLRVSAFLLQAFFLSLFRDCMGEEGALSNSRKSPGPGSGTSVQGPLTPLFTVYVPDSEIHEEWRQTPVVFFQSWER